MGDPVRILIALLLALAFVSAPAFAQREPVIAPAPEWVEAVPILDPNPAQRDRPFQILLLSTQSRYDGDQQDHFVENAILIQTPQGLQGAGNVTLAWQPDQSDLIVHKVHIIRGGQVIDLLANGQTFTVLRRENNLETAMLDGVLTAVLQPEGLAVGDIVNIAYTLHRRPGTIALRGENFFASVHGMPVRQLLIRQVWAPGTEMRWHGTDLYRDARTRATRYGTELVVDRRDAEGPEPPVGAPARFQLPARLEISGWRDWNEISRAFAPLYARASELSPNSPLQAQIDRVAAASTDPRARTLAALRLVQDEVRYLALTMGEGNFLPATADQTWTRRYGDCKGKTALLLALLRGLGVEAEPVVVNSRFGDMLSERLPQTSAFDHVIVRARIDGVSYWLDGTRSGDRAIEDLRGDLFAWGLPLRAAGAELEAIPLPTLAQPNWQADVTYDASQGFADRVPAHVELTARGQSAAVVRFGVAQVGREAFVRQLRESTDSSLPNGFEITSTDIRDDEASGSFTIILSGTGRLDMRRVPGLRLEQYKFDNTTIRWDPSIDRPDSQPRDAPYIFDYPYYSSSTETIILPNHGRGFTIDGGSFERTIAGARISRDVRIQDGRAVAHMALRRITREVPAGEMRAAVEPLRAIVDDNAWLRTPEGRTTERTEVSGPPARAMELIQRGATYLDDRNYALALADFDEAARLAPQWSNPAAFRAIALVLQGNVAEAETTLARAAALGAPEAQIDLGRGLIHLTRGELEQAATAFTSVLESGSAMPYARLQRATVYQRLGRLDEALEDLDALLAADPANFDALTAKATLLAFRNDADNAVAAADAALAAVPDPGVIMFRAEILQRVGRMDEARAEQARALAALDPATTEIAPEMRAAARGGLLQRAGQHEQAIAAYDEAIALQPNDARFLNNRCWARGISNIQLEAALADCDRAVALQPRGAGYLDSRALVRLRLGRVEEAISDENEALSIRPYFAEALFVRGVARIRNGDRPGGEADLALARRLSFDIDARYRDYGVTP